MSASSATSGAADPPRSRRSEVPLSEDPARRDPDGGARSFNTTGACITGEHDMLPPERVQQLIEQRNYFTVHAGRQTGKTTSVMWLEQHLARTGRWRAV